jgi:hypothetical protein
MRPYAAVLVALAAASAACTIVRIDIDTPPGCVEPITIELLALHIRICKPQEEVP